MHQIPSPSIPRHRTAAQSGSTKSRPALQRLGAAVLIASLLQGGLVRADPEPIGTTSQPLTTDGTGTASVGSVVAPVQRAEAAADARTGAATLSYPFELPHARGTAQPALGLQYSSQRGVGEAGLGWSFDLPVVERRGPGGPPTFQDLVPSGNTVVEGRTFALPSGEYLATRDRFHYGGQPLVLVCFRLVGGACEGQPDARAEKLQLDGPIPTWAQGWSLYRLEREGTFGRFFWSPDRRTWRVQWKSGETLELGAPLAATFSGDTSTGLVLERGDPARVLRWNLVRQYDAHGSDNAPLNPIVYRWNLGVLTDIYFTPAIKEGTTGLGAYAHHVRIVQDSPTIAQQAWAPAWRRPPGVLLTRVEIASRTLASSGPRQLVRRYHLTYDRSRNRPLLATIQVEGRCASPIVEEGQWLPFATCPRLPATTYTYAPVFQNAWVTTKFQGDKLADRTAGDKKTNVALLDVDGDGLTDLLTASESGAYAVYINSYERTSGSRLRRETLSVPPVPSPLAPGRVVWPFRADQGQTVVGDWLGIGRASILFRALLSATGDQAQGVQKLFALVRGPQGWSLQPVEGRIAATFTTDLRDERDAVFADVDQNGLPDRVVRMRSPRGGNRLGSFLADRMHDGRLWQFRSGSEPPGNAAETRTTPLPFDGRKSSNRLPREDFLADVNGDGFPDAVKIVGNDTLKYFPGRGDGTFRACYDDSSCVDELAVTMPFTPEQLAAFTIDIDVTGPLADVLLHDINGDGFADLIIVHKRFIYYALNRQGRKFDAPRALLDAAFPAAIDQVSVADMNGSGVDDIVVFVGGEVSYFDFALFGEQPDLLTRVSNGYGAVTEITYTSLTELAYWATPPWATSSPAPAHVVTLITRSDGLPSRVGDSFRRELTYRDPAYDSWERRLIGFRSVIAAETAEPHSARIETQSTFTGVCQSIAMVCPPAPNDPLRATWGRPVVIERFDAAGNYESTTHEQYRLTELDRSIDGRTVVFVHPSLEDTYLYDTSRPRRAEDVTVSDVVPFGSNVPAQTRTMRLRATLVEGRIHLRNEVDLDFLGNPTQLVRSGRVSEDGGALDPPIVTHLSHTMPAPSRTWQFRTAQVTTDAFAPSAGEPPSSARTSRYTYNASGDLLGVRAVVAGTVALDRFHEDPTKAIAPTPPTAVTNGEAPLADYQVDAFGNVVRARGPGGRCSELRYDPLHQDLLVTRTAYTDGCGSGALTETLAYDRGLEAVTSHTAPSGALTTSTFDGFGRPIEINRPDPARPGVAVPWRRLQYVTTAEGPVQRTHISTTNGRGGFEEAWQLENGFGRLLMTLRQADPSAGDLRSWVASGLPDLLGGWEVYRYRPWFLSVPDPATYVPTDTSRAGAYLDGGTGYDLLGRPTDLYGTNGELVAHQTHHPLSLTIVDAEGLLAGGPHAGTSTTITTDGHRRVREVSRTLHEDGSLEAVRTSYAYQSTGEPTVVTQSHSGDEITRFVQYDSLGRMVVNAEPNTSLGDLGVADAAAIKAWRYAYDLSGNLVGTSDARGCGKNLAYDGLGRLVYEDYSPCRKGQLDYTRPNSTDGTGTEAFYRYDSPEAGQSRDLVAPPPGVYLGRLASVADRASHTQLSYDLRGRLTGVDRQIARPVDAAPSLVERYAPKYTSSRLSYDGADRLVRQTTGADVPALVGADGTSAVSFEYSARGMVRKIGSSYGVLLDAQTVDADGQPVSMRYGDLGRTTATLTYDSQRRLVNHRVARAAPATPRVLLDAAIAYDGVGNPIRIEDRRDPAEWPAGAKPVTRAMTYDDFYRLTGITYVYGAGDDVQVSPFRAELDRSDMSPVRRTSVPRRVRSQTFDYDWKGDLRASDDDIHVRFDRSLGRVTDGMALGHPNQLFATDAGLAASYDMSGNLEHLTVPRQGPCELTADQVRALGGRAPATQTQDGYTYEWDEVGQLTRALRWDDAVPMSRPAADLRFAYDHAGRRVLDIATRADGSQAVTSEILPTLRLDRARFDASLGDYERTAQSESLTLAGLARVAVSATPLPVSTGKRQHVYLMLGDRLGSTSVVFDKDTSELVEAITYQAFGAPESDHRPTRWASQRADYRFTGKEDDTEVGLVYFGARYYHPALNRWISPDPLTIHGLGASANPYAYVNASPLRYVDPLGLQEQGPPAPGGYGGGYGGGTGPAPGSGGGCDLLCDYGHRLEHGAQKATEWAGKAVSDAWDAVSGIFSSDDTPPPPRPPTGASGVFGGTGPGAAGATAQSRAIDAWDWLESKGVPQGVMDASAGVTGELTQGMSDRLFSAVGADRMIHRDSTTHHAAAGIAFVGSVLVEAPVKGLALGAKAAEETHFLYRMVKTGADGVEQVLKFGTTKNPFRRYPKWAGQAMNGMGVRMEIMGWGVKSEVYAAERALIQGYTKVFGKRPFWNLVDH